MITRQIDQMFEDLKDRMALRLRKKSYILLEEMQAKLEEEYNKALPELIAATMNSVDYEMHQHLHPNEVALKFIINDLRTKETKHDNNR